MFYAIGDVVQLPSGVVAQVVADNNENEEVCTHCVCNDADCGHADCCAADRGDSQWVHFVAVSPPVSLEAAVPNFALPELPLPRMQNLGHVRFRNMPRGPNG